MLEEDSVCRNFSWNFLEHKANRIISNLLQPVLMFLSRSSAFTRDTCARVSFLIKLQP